MIYLQLYWEFFKIGLFAVGGGLATLPFLRELAVRTDWYTPELLADMVAVSESTPGPIGINMATYVGCNVAGFFGGVVATLGEITPSIIIVCLLAKSLGKFRDNPLMDKVFYGLRPAVTGLIAAAGITMMQSSFFAGHSDEWSLELLQSIDLVKVFYFALIYFAIKKFNKHPVLYIAISAVVGIIFVF